ncbi:MAG: transketolase [Clostridia bacterium]|nr:transketolase [Clostridia bacterium]
MTATLADARLCLQMRRDILDMVYGAQCGHPGGSLSCVEILAALYFHAMQIDPARPAWAERDRFILSKGHAAPAYYAALCRRGYFSSNEYKSFRQLNGILQGHPDRKRTPGVDASTGSLGQGASFAVGVAMGERLRGSGVHVYALLGDGEMQEGIVWEALMAAAHYQLDNLTFVLDNNGLQIDGRNDEVMSLGDIKAKVTAFGWDYYEIDDGNNLAEVCAALDQQNMPGRPRFLLAHTVKGKGVSFMENSVEWHGKAPNAEEYRRAIQELGGISHA